jgi:hypothetical protein
VELTVLTVPDCPHGPVLEERLAEALGDRRGVVVRRRVIADAAEAAEAGLRGSPTLLVDGVDRFAEPGRPVSVSCRMFRGADGGLTGAPSVAELRTALASADAARPMVAGPGVWICADCVTLATDILATGGPVGAKPLRTG